MKKKEKRKGMPPGFGIWRFDTDWEFTTADLLGWLLALAIITGTILLCTLGLI